MIAKSPQEFARDVLAEAPDEAWLRRFADEVDRRVRTSPLERIERLWGLSAAQAARMFGVSRQAYSKWRRAGVPANRVAMVSDLSAATDLLDAKVKRERVPAVVRRPLPARRGRSLYDIACEGRSSEVRETVKRMFDLRRLQP